MRRVLTTLVMVLIVAGLTACERSSWKTDCSGDLNGRRCEVYVAGSSFHDLDFPWTGRLNHDRTGKFRLVSAVAGGEAHFQAAGVEGGLRCTQGETLTIGLATLTCTEVGDDSLRFTVERTA